jgi:hypothetical protein
MTSDTEARDQRMPIMMTRAEVEAIDDWMFANRYRTRAKAVRALVEAGLREPVNRKVDVTGVEVYNLDKRSLVCFESQHGTFEMRLLPEQLDELRAGVTEEQHATPDGHST